MLLIVQKSVKTVPKEEGEEEEEEEEGEYDGPRAPLQTGATTESAADPLHIASCSPYTPRIYTYFLEGNPPSSSPHSTYLHRCNTRGALKKWLQGGNGFAALY